MPYQFNVVAKQYLTIRPDLKNLYSLDTEIRFILVLLN